MVYSNTPTCFICIAAPVDLSLSLSTCICAKFDDDLGLSCPIEGSNLDGLVLTLDRSIIANRPLSSTPNVFHLHFSPNRSVSLSVDWRHYAYICANPDDLGPRPLDLLALTGESLHCIANQIVLSCPVWIYELLQSFCSRKYTSCQSCCSKVLMAPNRDRIDFLPSTTSSSSRGTWTNEKRRLS